MLKILKLDTQEGLENYKNLLVTLNASNPYFSTEYMDIFSKGTKNMICFVFFSSETNATIIMPGYLNPIVIGEEKTNYFDFISPYGYTGPWFSKNTVDSDIIKFWKLVDTWYRENKVVTEFIRFNLFGNHNHYSGETYTTLLNIKGKIIDQENQWTAFDHKVRKNVNKAKRENLYSEIYYLGISDEQIAEFHTIYIQTMIRTNANEHFLYTFEEFKKFLMKNENDAAICTIYFENITISSELLLISNDTMYSFLGGTNDVYFDKRPNDFLKQEVLNWGRNQGKKHYILGGGYGFEDGIFKYKKAFFPNDVVNYYTGRKILNQEIYNKLVEKSSNFRLLNKLNHLDLEDTFFPLYNNHFTPSLSLDI